MAVTPSLLDYHRRMAALMVALSGGRLSMTECLRPGSDLWVHCRAPAIGMQLVAFEAMQREAALYLDSASGERLDRLVLDRYGLKRDPASPSQGTVVVRAAAPPAEDVIVAAGAVLLTTEGIRVATLFDVTLPAGSTAWQSVTAQSVVAASGQNIAAGTVTGFESPPVNGAQASNATADGGTAFVGSADAQTDESLREQARRYWTTQRRATLASLELGALDAVGVTQATAYEVEQWDGTYGGHVFLFVSDGDGNSSPAMEAAVVAALEEWRAAGIAVTVTGGVPQYVAVVLDLTLSAGYDLSAVKTNIVNALVAYGKTLKPGETMPIDGIREAVYGVAGVVKNQSTVSTPPGDVAPTTTSSVLRIRTSDVTFI